MGLQTGSRLGPYEIRGIVGRGGMGEVYRAVDTRLNRTVAIKVVTDARAGDETIHQRFQREARALSALRHPHICALYDIGDTSVDGRSVPYLVMEYLEGQTLDELLKRGALPFDRVLRYGVEIADALHKAHRQRILHRDLKPGNIIITHNGVSLLDFGLAKTLAGSRQSDSAGLDSTDTTSLTTGGPIGTLHYMSPEQLEDKAPDERTDIFALGVCLYQMSTGRRPFEGQSRADIVAAILKHDPAPPSSVGDNIPPPFDWIVKRCLAKDLEDRFQNAHDVKLELQHIAESETTASRPAPTLDRAGWSLAALLVLLLIAGASYVIRQSRTNVHQTAPGVRRFSVTLPQQAAIDPGFLEKLAVSGDGSRIAYIGAGDPPSLDVYSLQDRSVTRLPQTDNARSPFFSPDGRWIGFTTADGSMEKLSVDGGAPLTIGKTGQIRGASWGRNNEIVFCNPWSASLKLISVDSGVITTLPPLSDSRFEPRWPQYLPDGRRVLFTMFNVTGDFDNSELAILDLDSHKTAPLVKGATYGRLVSPEQLIYLRSGTLFTLPFNAADLKVTGDPTPRVSDANFYYPSGLAHFAVAGDGTLFYIPHDPNADSGELVWVDRRGGITPVSPVQRAYLEPSLSPDASRIAVRVSGRTNSELWLYDIPRQSWQPITTVTGFRALWSPDGKTIAFPSNRNGSINLFTMPIDGSTPPRQITHTKPTEHWPYASSWSPDGRTLAIFEQFKDTATDIYTTRLDREEAPRPFIATTFNEALPVFSPDGAWLAYESDISGRYEIYVTRFPEDRSRWVVSSDGGNAPHWSRDGRELFYRNGRKLMVAGITGGSQFKASKPRMLFEGDFGSDFDVAPDASKFLMVKRPESTPQTEIRVVSGLATQ